MKAIYAGNEKGPELASLVLFVLGQQVSLASNINVTC